jgi:hypothetical protein
MIIYISKILIFDSHNHSGVNLLEQDDYDYNHYQMVDEEFPEVKLTSVGDLFVTSLLENVRALPGQLQPVKVLWTQGQEGRITYNRKGRRADGSTYYMREEDRRLIGNDYNGDIDQEVPVVVFQGQDGNPVAAVMQFTGHPVTSYHPESPVIFGDYPTVATDRLGKALDYGTGPIPVAFLQGCAGDISSKEMLYGSIERATEFGEMLGQSAIDALAKLKPSVRDGMDYVVRKVYIPLAPLPDKTILQAEIDEMEDFMSRADAGDEDTLTCVGLNFPRAFSPKYRGALLKDPMKWSKWALSMYKYNQEHTVMRTIDLSVYVLRVGDVAIIGMPFEPFQGMGRQIRTKSPYPLTIPCGYVNGTHGYITDSANTGDGEYMSAFYRYTTYRPPLAKPAGDVVAVEVVNIIMRCCKD